jgi:hypothetical protein
MPGLAAHTVSRLLMKSIASPSAWSRMKISGTVSYDSPELRLLYHCAGRSGKDTTYHSATMLFFKELGQKRQSEDSGCTVLWNGGGRL